MKRNIIVILTLALVCVLFVACGKEEAAPIDVAIGELQAARENIDNQIAALEAQRPATKGGSGAVLTNAEVSGNSAVPVGKTREEMTETEREAYDRAKIAEFAEQVKNDPSIDVKAVLESGAIPNMGEYRTDDGWHFVYIPRLEELPDEVRRHWDSPRDPYQCAHDLSLITEDECSIVYDYFKAHPEYIVPIALIAEENTKESEEKLREIFRAIVDGAPAWPALFHDF